MLWLVSFLQIEFSPQMPRPASLGLVLIGVFAADREKQSFRTLILRE